MIRKRINRNVTFIISIWVGLLPLISGCNSSLKTEINFENVVGYGEASMPKHLVL